MGKRTLAATVLCLLLGGLLGPGQASAFRASLKPNQSPPGEEGWITRLQLETLPPATEEQIEGACGDAVFGERLYVSDYYHRAVHRFTTAGAYVSTQFLASNGQSSPINQLNAVCGLAIDAKGTLYANEFHQRVLRLPGEETIDPGPATGVAVDTSGNLYVDDRSYVAVYEAPVEPGDEPATKIGLGSLEDAYGVAVDSNQDRVYVADAGDDTVKAFEPKVSLVAPVKTIAGPPGGSFNSLVNASLAVDESSTEGKGHLLVVDDLGPLFARPLASVLEFGPEGEYLDTLAPREVIFRGQAKPAPVFGEPSGIAVDQSTGKLFVTTGNSEEANVLAYGPFEAQAPQTLPPSGEESETTAGPPPLALSTRSAGVAPTPAPSRGKGGSESVIVRHGPVQVRFNGKLTPHSLPRRGTAPVGIAVDVRISATDSDNPPQLRRIAIAINRNGRLGTAGLPVCRLDQIQPSTSAGAMAACGDALVGEGRFSANVKLPQQSPFPSEGRVLAFNGRLNGHPAILAHIFGPKPVPTSVVLPFEISSTHGTYGTILRASLPRATGNWGYVTGLRMNLRRSFRYRGKTRSYLSAGCPAPPGFPSAVFPLTRTSFAFAGGPTLSPVLTRTCRAKG